MTSDEEARLWRAELLASRRRYAAASKEERGPADSPAVQRAKELIRESREIVAESRALRSRNR